MSRHKRKSIKVNFLMNAFLTCSNFIFPLITFPYVSRVLLADGNGKGIHRKPYGNETQLDQTHLLLPLFCCPALLLLYEQAA